VAHFTHIFLTGEDAIKGEERRRRETQEKEERENKKKTGMESSVAGFGFKKRVWNRII
jgi:hypothetical protein